MPLGRCRRRLVPVAPARIPEILRHFGALWTTTFMSPETEQMMRTCARSVRLWIPVVASLFLTPAAALAVSEDAKLTASDGATFDNFGTSVSIFGNTALIGASVDRDGNGQLTGSAYVFRFDGNSWVEEAKLTASDGADGDSFGDSVSISSDTALIGAPGNDGNGSHTGSAYVFRYDGNSWVEEAKLTASDGGSGDNFGGSVSTSANTFVVGADGDDDNGSESGSAYVFRYDGSSWVEEAKLTASDGFEGNFFGSSVSIFGNVTVIGAFFDNDGNGQFSGSAYSFRYNGSSWVEEAKLTASDGATEDQFGFSVSTFGNATVIGSPFDDDNGSYSGSVYVFGEPAPPPYNLAPTLSPLGVAILLGLIGTMVYLRLRDSASAA